VDDDDAARRHHRQRPGGGQDRRDHLVSSPGRRRLVGVEALDVEGLQPVLHHRGELDREVVARLQVVAFEQVERTGAAGGDLRAHLDRLHRR